ncbi:MAG: DNA cytosine methyltransferase [Ktedonobacteraceae bacterium]
MTYTCIDSFSGAGGLSLGLLKAGYHILLSFDNDTKCIQTQRSNPKYFQHEAYLANIDSMLNGVLLEKVGLRRGDLFILVGGPPCQGFSVQRIGVDEDIRNNLVPKFIELVEELLPRYFLMENVPGIMGKRGKILFKESLDRAVKAGYWLHQRTLDAQDYGVPQRRKRVFIIGERNDGSFPSFWFPPVTTPVGQRVTVQHIIGHLPPPPGDGSDHLDILHHRSDKLSEMNKRRLLALQPGQGRDLLPEELLADCHRVSSSRIGHRNVYGRMAWNDVAPTITAKFDSFTRGQFGHPEQVRSISLREGALLQTFPIDFVFSGNKVDIARQIGNAVPPLLAEVLGKQILICHESKLKDQQLV